MAKEVDHLAKVKDCPIEHTLQLISGKWKSVIIRVLLKQPVCRFSELQKAIPDCSRRMLSLQLKELVKDGLVQKHVYATVPPKTEYSLTEAGRGLRSLIDSMQEWGRKDLDQDTK